MIQFFISLALRIYNNQTKAIIGILIVLVGIFALGISQLKLSSDLVDILPKNHPEVAKYQNTIENFNPLNRAFFTLSGAEQDQLIVAADALVAILDRTKLFSQIKYQWQPEDVLETIQVLSERRAALFSAQAERNLTDVIKHDTMRTALEIWKRRLSESPAPFLSQAFMRDPIGVNKFLYDKLDALQSFGSALSSYRGRLFSKDETQLLIMAFPNSSATSSEESEQFFKAVSDAVTAIEQQHKIDIAWLSSHRFAYVNETQMRADIGLATTISLVGIFTLCFLVFRRPFLPLLALIPVLCAALAALGLLPLLYSPVSLIALGIGSVLLGLSIDYGLHVLFHLDGFHTIQTSAIREVVEKIAKPLAASALTTVLAFGCLQVSVLPSYQQFGAFATVGIFAAWLVAVCVLPALASHAKKTRPRAIIEIEDFFQKLIFSVQKRSLLISTLLVVVTVLTIPGVLRVQIDGDVKNLYLGNARLQKEMERVNDAFGNAMQSTTLLVKGSTLNEALERTKHLHEHLAELSANEGIDSFFTLYPYLPSESEQKQNIKRWNQFWTQDRLTTLRRDLYSAGRRVGVNPAAFNSFLEQLNRNDHRFIDLDTYRNTPLNELIESQISIKDNVQVLANARIDDVERLSRLQQQLKMPDGWLTVIDGRHFVNEMIDLIFSELETLGLAAIVCIFMTLLLFHGLGLAFAMTMPLVASLIWTFGLLGWLQIPVNVMNCVIILLIFGLVVDYSVFLASSLTANYPTQATTGRALGAIFISALTTLCAVGALTFAQHPALRAMGVTTLIGITSGLFAVLLILPTVRGVNIRLPHWFRKSS